MMKVKVTGVKSTNMYLMQKKQLTNKQVSDSLEESSELLKSEVEKSISGQEAEPRSVDTGNYLGSIDNQSDDSKAVIFTPVDYAKFLEYGTVKIDARRHFQNSFDRNKGNIMRIFRQKITV